ncbi:MAG: cytochrome b [Gammaproteobacteria bacterium]|nr:cytochrome b [Gammaproteobacteria bacterium]
MWLNSTDSYGYFSKFLHWIMAIIIIGLMAVGLYMTELDKDDSSRRGLYQLHKEFGLTIIFLGIIRIIWITISHPPSLPTGLKVWETKLAKSTKHLLYLLILLVPASGYIMSTLLGYPVDVFGLFEFPLLFDKNKETGEIFRTVHMIIAYCMIGVLALHIAGAVKHRLFDHANNDVLKRML